MDINFERRKRIIKHFTGLILSAVLVMDSVNAANLFSSTETAFWSGEAEEADTFLDETVSFDEIVDDEELPLIPTDPAGNENDYLAGEPEDNVVSEAEEDGKTTAADTGLVSAATIDSGRVNRNITWTLDEEGVLTISGKGYLDDYAYEELPESFSKVIIRSGITEIGEYAFMGCGHLESVELPPGLKRIENGALEFCRSLKSIEIPQGVTDIGPYVFLECSSLTKIIIPSSVRNIGEDAFHGCASLDTVQIDEKNSCYVFHDGVLFDKDMTLLIWCAGSKEGKFTVPSGVKEIGYHAFSDCTGLKEIILLSGVERLGREAFYKCKGLKYITLPPGLTSIEEAAFRDCQSLNQIELPSGVTDIGPLAFADCKSLSDIKIPSSVTSIGRLAFSGCTGLKIIDIDVENRHYCFKDGSLFDKDMAVLFFCLKNRKGVYRIPSSVVSIENYAFCDCDKLTEVVIPSGVEQIGDKAFSGCSNLEKITIPASVRHISEWWVFDSCPKLTIYGKAGSYAQSYAMENGIPFVATDKKTETLSAPAALKAQNTSAGVKVSWNAVTNARKYKVYRVSDGASVDICSTSDRSYTDKTVSNGNAYQYYVLAVGYKTDTTTYKTSARSKTEKIIYLASPTGVKAVRKSKNKAVLSWNANSKAEGYKIRYCTESDMNGARTVTIRKNSTKSHTLKNLSGKKTYYIQIRAYKKANGKSYYSTWSAKKKVLVR